MTSSRLDDQVQDLLRACRILLHQGLTEAFGHVSVREGNQMLITPRGPITSARTPHDLVAVDLSAEPPVIGPNVPPEAFLHVGIYRARADVNAILRYHGPYQLAVSTVVEEFRPAIGYGAYVGVVPVHQDPRLVRDPASGDAVARTLGSAAAVLLRGNGAATVGDGVDEATVRALFLERAAMASCRAGLDRARGLSDDEIGFYAGLPDARTAQISRAWIYYSGLVESASNDA